MISANFATACQIRVNFGNTKTTSNNPFIKSATASYTFDQITTFYYSMGLNQIRFSKPLVFDFIRITNIDAFTGFVQVIFELEP